MNIEMITGAPDKRGRYGDYGGKFVPETLMVALEELEAAYREYREDEEFQRELDFLLKTYVGRPTPLYFASNLTQRLGGAKVYLKREDLAHTGAHKINNALGQGLLAKRLGKEPDNCRNGRGTARSSVGNGVRHAGVGVHCVHGHGGYPAAGVERISDAAVGGGGGAGGCGQPDIEGCD